MVCPRTLAEAKLEPVEVVPSPNDDRAGTTGVVPGMSVTRGRTSHWRRGPGLDDVSVAVENFSRTERLGNGLRVKPDDEGFGRATSRYEIVVQVHVTHLGEGGKPSGQANNGQQDFIHGCRWKQKVGGSTVAWLLTVKVLLQVKGPAACTRSPDPQRSSARRSARFHHPGCRGGISTRAVGPGQNGRTIGGCSPRSVAVPPIGMIEATKLLPLDQGLSLSSHQRVTPVITEASAAESAKTPLPG